MAPPITEINLIDTVKLFVSLPDEWITEGNYWQLFVCGVVLELLISHKTCRPNNDFTILKN